MITLGQREAVARQVERRESSIFTGTLLVTGGESELGGALGRLLHDNGMSVSVQCDSSKHRQDGVRTFPMPLLDPEFGDRVSELQPDVILHCHGEAPREGGSRSSYASYCVTMDRIAALCEVTRKAAPTARVVLLNPDAAARGDSAYARFARLAETLLSECGAAFDLKTTVLQTGQLFGAGLRFHVVYDILFRLHAAGETVAELPFAEDEELDLIHVSDFATTVRSVLGRAMSDVVRLEGTKIRACALAEMLARLTESRKPYRFARQVEEMTRGTAMTRAVYSSSQGTDLAEAVKNYAEWWLGRK